MDYDIAQLFFVGGMSAIVLFLPTLLVAMAYIMRPARTKVDK